MYESILAALPLIIAGVVPPLLIWFRENITKIVPDRYVPVLLPVAGGLVAGLAKAAGFDVADFNASTADFDAWETVIAGVLSGLAANGVHQIGKQLQQPTTTE